jgi:glucose/arabinose dehydrogenase
MKEIFFVIVIFSSIPFVFAQEYPDLGVKVETIAENLDIPWSIVWDPDGTIFFTERNGNVRIIQDGIVSEKPILSLDVGGGEGGLLGIALDPNYLENHYIYLFYTYNNFFSIENKVVRYVESNLTLSENKVLIDKIPGGPFHDGGRIQFGPDGKLYITTGETGNTNLAQDKNSVAGKILRINSDGSIPEDNPFSGSPIYSYGHRNPQGLDWDESGNLVATEHGPRQHDEINVIVPGANYGWPDIIGDETMEGLVTPIMNTGDDTWAPSGAEFYDGNKIPQWTGKFFVATLRGNHLHMIDFDIEKNKVLSHQKLFTGDFGRLRDVATGPDGYLYFLTSNRDGRGYPEINDDRILRIVPLNEINSFKDCISAGNPIMESYPRQCRTANGQTFVEEIQISEQKIPQWVRNIFLWYAQDQVSEDELLNAIKFLVQQNIIKLD